MVKGLLTYQLYCSLKTHFERDSYSFTSYKLNPKSFSEEKFRTRNDRTMFAALESLYEHDEKEEHLKLVLSSFFVHQSFHIKDILEQDKKRTVYLATRLMFRDAPTRTFQNEIEAVKTKYNKGLGSFLSPPKGRLPDLVGMFKRDEISPETVIMLDHFTSFMSIRDDFTIHPVWPDFQRRIMKFRFIMSLPSDVINQTYQYTKENLGDVNVLNQ